MLTAQRPRRPRASRVRRRRDRAHDRRGRRAARRRGSRRGDRAARRRRSIRAAAIARAARPRAPADPLARAARTRSGRSSPRGSSTSSSSPSRRSSSAAPAPTRASRSSRATDLLPGGPLDARTARRPPRRRPPLPALRARQATRCHHRRVALRPRQPRALPPGAMSLTSLRSSQALTNAALAGSLAAADRLVRARPAPTSPRTSSSSTSSSDHGFALWTNYWYAGRYTFVGYSLLYYPLAALVGIKLLAVLSVAASTAAFTLVIRQTWGESTVWATRLLRGRRRGVGRLGRLPLRARPRPRADRAGRARAPAARRCSASSPR